MNGECIEQRNGGYYVHGTRISLDQWYTLSTRATGRAHPGPSASWPERILERYPLLGKLSKVYGAIAFYLDHQAEIDAYLEAGRREFETTGIPLSESNPALWDRLEQARLKMTS